MATWSSQTFESNTKQPNNQNEANVRCAKCSCFISAAAEICQFCGWGNAKKLSTAQSHPKDDNTDDIKYNDNKIQQNKSSEKWNCPQCTLQNKASSKYCKVCKTLKPKYCWQWKMGKTWNQYPEQINQQIETAYSSNITTIEFKISDKEYIIDLTKYTQINKATKKATPIQRVEYEEKKPSKKLDHKVPVMLNIYQSSTLYGAYHTGVEVHGVEYSYGNGICMNDVPPGWIFYQQEVIHKDCKKTKNEIQTIIAAMDQIWTCNGYNLTKNNCNHFSDAFIKRLCGKDYGIPSWINSLANMGSAVEDMTGSNVMDIVGGFMTSFNASNTSYNAWK